MRYVLRRYYFALNEIGMDELVTDLHTKVWSAVAENALVARLKVCNEHGECGGDYADCNVVVGFLEMFHLKEVPADYKPQTGLRRGFWLRLEQRDD